MTAIIGYADKDGTVYIGADSLGANRTNCGQRDDPKVFRNGEFLIGYTTSFRMGQLIRFKAKFPEQLNSQGDYEYMCTSFVDTIISTFKENKWLGDDDGLAKGGTFLVGYKGKLYMVESDMQVAIPAYNFEACGSGAVTARGAMFALERDLKLTPEERIIAGLEIASEFTQTVRKPFRVEKLEYKPQ